MQGEIAVKEIKAKKAEDFLKKLDKSKKDYTEKRVHKAEEVFKELRQKYEY